MEAAIGVQTYQLHRCFSSAILFKTSCPFEKWLQLKICRPQFGELLKSLPRIEEYFFQFQGKIKPW